MLRSALLILSGNAAASILTLARNLIVARLISVENYGIAATFAIAMAVVEMASALGIGTVAEGAESEAQLAALRRLGADYVQGYLLSRPLAPDEVERALADID